MRSWLVPLESSVSQHSEPLFDLFHFSSSPFFIILSSAHGSSRAMGDVGRPLRPIAPRITPLGGRPGGDRPGGGAGNPPDEGKMKRASTACKECQKRRTRCTGMPCTECTTHGRECITDELSDKRRKASAKKTQGELAETTALLISMVDLIRDGDYGTVNHFIHTIRGGADLEAIRAYIQALANQPPSSQPPIQSPHHSHHGVNPNLMDPNMRNFFDPNVSR